MCKADRAQFAGRAASRTTRNGGTTGEVGCARIDTEVGQARVHRREQLADVRSTNRTGVGTADGEAVGRLPASADLVGRRFVARAGRRFDAIFRITNSAFDRQALEERLVLHERNGEFADRFVNVIAATDVRRGTTGTTQIARLGKRVRSLTRLILAIFGTDRKRDRVIGKRTREAEVASDRALRLCERATHETRAFLDDETHSLRRDGSEEIARNTTIRGVEANRRCCGTAREQRLPHARIGEIPLDRLVVLALAIGTRDIPIDRISDAATETDTVIEDRRYVLADSRAGFNRATRQQRLRVGIESLSCFNRSIAVDVERGETAGSDFTIIRLTRTERAVGRRVAHGLRKARRVDCRARIDVERAELIARRRWQEGVVQRNVHADPKCARRRNDRVDGVLREQAARIDFDRVADLVTRLTEHVVTLERRLEHVERIEVERRERRHDLAGIVDLVGRAVARVRGRYTDRAGKARAREARRKCRARTKRGAAKGLDRRERDVTRALIHRVRFLIPHREDCVAASVVEIGTDRRVNAELVAVALLGDLFRQLELGPGEIALGDEVDDTRDGVSTIGRRCTAGENVDTLDKCERDVVQIGTTEQIGRCNAVAVKQHDVAVRTEATKVDVRCTAVAVVDGRTDAWDDARNFAKNFLGDVRALKLDFLGGRDVDRRCALEVRVRNERAGDDDRVAFGGGRFGGCSRRGRLRECGSREQRAGDDRRREQLAANCHVNHVDIFP